MFHHIFRYLYRIVGGSLSQIVSHDPEVEAAGNRKIFPDSADKHIILP
jgi:hypothetical protein